MMMTLTMASITVKSKRVPLLTIPKHWWVRLSQKLCKWSMAMAAHHSHRQQRQEWKQKTKAMIKISAAVDASSNAPNTCLTKSKSHQSVQPSSANGHLTVRPLCKSAENQTKAAEKTVRRNQIAFFFSHISFFPYFFPPLPEPEQLHDCRRLLEIENMLLKYDLDIKASLQLSSADPAKCITVLEEYKSLNVTALMLKKNPSTVETVKRLRRYVGNIKDWNFDESQRAEFNENATKIRKLAEIIYKNFKVIECQD